MKVSIADCCKCVFRDSSGKVFMVLAPSVSRAKEIATERHGKDWTLTEIHPFSSYNMSMTTVNIIGM